MSMRLAWSTKHAPRQRDLVSKHWGWEGDTDSESLNIDYKMLMAYRSWGAEAKISLTIHNFTKFSIDQKQNYSLVTILASSDSSLYIFIVGKL